MQLVRKRAAAAQVRRRILLSRKVKGIYETRWIYVFPVKIIGVLFFLQVFSTYMGTFWVATHLLELLWCL